MASGSTDAAGYWQQRWQAKQAAERLLAEVTRAHGVGARDILSPSRMPHVIAARWDYIARLRAEGMSIRRIARLVGRDRTTVRHALKKHAQAS